MLSNPIFGTCGCNSCNNGTCGCNSGCGCNNGVMGASTGSNLGSSAFCFVGEWVNIVVTLTVLQSILGLVCNWNCGCNN